MNSVREERLRRRGDRERARRAAETAEEREQRLRKRRERDRARRAGPTAEFEERERRLRRVTAIALRRVAYRIARAHNTYTEPPKSPF